MPANAGDTGPVPGSGRSPGEGNGNPLQYFCLENSMDRGAWQLQSGGLHRVGRPKLVTKQQLVTTKYVGFSGRGNDMR